MKKNKKQIINKNLKKRFIKYFIDFYKIYLFKNKQIYFIKIYKKYFINLFIGDIILINYELKGKLYNFKGICIALIKFKLLNTNSLIILRNYINNVVVENWSILFKSNLFLEFYDYERKMFFYKTSKIFYLRKKKENISLINWI